MAFAFAPLPMVEELQGLFNQAGVAGEIELYPGVHHGFAFPQRWCYDKPAAERQFRATVQQYPEMQERVAPYLHGLSSK